MKRLYIFLLLVFKLQAANEMMLTGQWNSITHSLNNGTKTTEQEFLKFNTDHTFKIILLVTVEKGNAFVKNLRIEGTGIWKTRGNVLVAVVNDMEVPSAGEVYQISQHSLESIASTFHNRFKNDPIQILVIKELSPNLLVTENQNRIITTYKR